MSVSLEPFDINATCRKCGGQDISTRFCEKPINYPGCHCYAPHGADEHMDRTCRRCGFGWAEIPLDVAAEQQADMIEGRANRRLEEMFSPAHSRSLPVRPGPEKAGGGG